MLRRLELPRDSYGKLMHRAAELKIDFLSTPFDPDSLALLIGLGLPCLKIGSGDLTNAPLLLEAARSGRDIILSTGMADVPEIEEALGVLAFGYAGGTVTPGRAAFRKAFADDGTRSLLARRILITRCWC